MSNMIINYSKTVYDNKISELESYIKQLDGHRANLEGYRDKIRNVWDDSEAERYYSNLSEQILAVKNAAQRTTDLKTIYERASADFAKQKALTSGLIGDSETAIKALGIAKD